jgi:hypothetical protein
MPKFVVEREIPGAGNLSDTQLREISQKSVNVLKEMGPKIQWLHSYVTGDKVYCVYLAPDEATIQEHARRVGIPVISLSCPIASAVSIVGAAGYSSHQDLSQFSGRHYCPNPMPRALSLHRTRATLRVAYQ